MKHLITYYSKQELIKLSKNMQIKIKDIDNIDLIVLSDKEKHHNFCELVSKNDIS